MRHLVSLIATMMVLCVTAHAQENATPASSLISPRYFDKVSDKASALTEKIDRKTEKMLARFQRRQDKIQKRLFKIDSVAAKNIFTAADERAKALEHKLNNPSALTQYIPFLDTLKTSLKFLNKNKTLIANAGAVQGKLDGSMTKINALEGQLQKAEQVKKFLNEQKQFLKDQLSRFGFARLLGKLNKDVYYYGQQINEYKETLKDPKKIERKAIDILSRTKLFQNFMQKNSMLASLFRMPSDDPNDPGNLQNLAGLQTRTQVNQLIQNQVGVAGPGGMQQAQANINQAQSALRQLKDKAAKYGNGSGGDDMPDFKANNQKSKSLLKRLEYGTNIQTQKTTSLFPVTSDIGLSLGYKFSDRSVLGAGASYKIGWGENIRHVHITNQGLGLRSYLDIKYKKSLWITGGFELNYRTLFNRLAELKEYNAWQKSGLIGLTKKLPINTKFFKNTKVQLLWDFLSYDQVPRTQPLVFRIGYGIK